MVLIINTIGLILDIVGVFLIWQNELAPKILEPNDGGFFLGTREETNELKKSNQKKFKKIKRGSVLGLILVIVGFSLQIFGNILEYFQL